MLHTLGRTRHTFLLLGCLLAGCFAQVVDSDQPVEGLSQELTCDVTGSWALRVTSNVAWPSAAPIAAGTGQITDWLLVTRSQSGRRISDSSRLCGSTLPDFKSTAAFGGETYGLTYANAMFDHVPPYVTGSTARVTTTREEGEAFSTSSQAALLGLTLTNPLTDPWPAVGAVVQSDTDQDAIVGVTLSAKTGGSYRNPIVSFMPATVRATKAHFARRLAYSLNGTINTCDRISGNATVSKQDRRVLGCIVTAGSACTTTQRNALEGSIPTWSVNNATFTSVKLTADATCANVRAAAF